MPLEFQELTVSLRPGPDGTGFHNGIKEALRNFPLSHLPKELMNVTKQSLSPPILHLGYPMSDDAMCQFVEDHHLPVLIPEVGAEDIEADELDSEEETRWGTIESVFRFFVQQGITSFKPKYVCVTLGDSTTTSFISIGTNWKICEATECDIGKLRKLLGREEPPKWYPDYIGGCWRPRVNGKKSIPNLGSGKTRRVRDRNVLDFPPSGDVLAQVAKQ